MNTVQGHQRHLEPKNSRVGSCKMFGYESQQFWHEWVGCRGTNAVIRVQKYVIVRHRPDPQRAWLWWSALAVECLELWSMI